MPHTSTLNRLVSDPRWVSGDLDEALHALTEAACGALDVDRASVWLMEDGRGIRCIHLYDRRSDEHRRGDWLAVAQAPAYFDAIAENRLVCIEDARNDPRTRGFTEGYLEPEDIGALMDAPVRIDGQLTGVVCHEHLGGIRAWTDAEQTFAASIGDLAALAIQSARRREAEQALLRREQEVRIALEAAGVADWSWSIDANRVRWSDGVAHMYGKPPGWSPAGVEAFLAEVHPDDRAQVQEQVRRALEEGSALYLKHRLVHAPETWLECRGHVIRDAEGRPVAMSGVTVDVTLRERQDDRMRASERLESLGRLAGGVAHDFNNLLTAIGGAAEMLAQTELTQRQGELVHLLRSSADRAAELTRQLLAFGRRQPNASAVVDAGHVARELGQLLERLLGERVTLHLDLADGAWVRADGAQLEQVLMNLALNARDAMPDGGGLFLSARVEGDEVLLRVRDEGRGMSASVRSRIFEPYFTTKPPGRGTGLGLALCHGVVEQLGGRIDVESTPGEGTTFDVWLPRAEAPVAEEEGGEGPVPPVRALHVLLVEDEPAVGTLLVRALEVAGHLVIHAPDGERAMELLKKVRPDVLVCDVALPGVSGPQVAQEARERHPGLPALFITGYAPGGIPPALSDIPVLTKPFRPVDLLRRVAALVQSAT